MHNFVYKGKIMIKQAKSMLFDGENKGMTHTPQVLRAS